MNFNLHFGELHSDNSINDKNNLFENYIPKRYKVKRILISFNCFSGYILFSFSLESLVLFWNSESIRGSLIMPNWPKILQHTASLVVS